MKHAILASACALALLLPQDPDDEARPKTPEVGDAAPLIRLNDHTGEATTVGGESESWTVLAYYPMAMTPG